MSVLRCFVMSTLAIAATAIAESKEVFAEDTPRLQIAGSWSGLPSQTEVARSFAREAKIRAGVVGLSNHRGFEFLKAQKVDVLMYTPEATVTVDEAVAKVFRDDAGRPNCYEFSQFVVHVLVHPSNSVRRMSFTQLRETFTGKVVNWRQAGGKARQMELAIEGNRQKSFEIVTNRVLGKGYFCSASHVFETSDEVVEFVAKTPGAIGFCLFRHKPFKGVRALQIAVQDDGPYYLPTEENVLAKKYPLTEGLLLFTRPGGKPEADRYCEFACSAACEEIAKRFCIFPASERAVYLGTERLTEFRAGKGKPIRVCGVAGGEDLTRHLALEHVKAKALVQAQYREQASQAEAVDQFRKEGELLILESGKPKAGSGLLGDGVAAAQAKLGIRAVGLVVHPDNAAKELTLEDLRLIYSGEIDKWPGVEGRAARIRIFGLASGSGAMKLVEERVQGDAGSPHPQTLSR